mgnify:FL=1
MDKIFGRAEDKYVRHYRLYCKSTSDGKVYVDSECKTQATTSEVKNAFLKGAFVDQGGKLYAITSYSEASSVATIVLLTVGASDAATLLKLVSKADS